MTTITLPVPAPLEPSSRVIFSQGGKGGVGKTSFMTALVEWFEDNELPHTLLDFDSENKARGSIMHYFPKKTRKINIDSAEGLDAVFDVLDQGPPLVLADMGAGSGKVTTKWFDAMYEGAREMGVAFTAIGMITLDPASVESVLTWANALQNRVQYLIVKNAISDPADFTYWERSTVAEKFREAFQPREINMEYRLTKFEGPARQHGATLGKVAQRAIAEPELLHTAVVMRAQAYRRNLFAELDRVKDLLLL